MTETKKSFWAGIFGGKKSACCNIQIEELGAEGDQSMTTYVYETIPARPGEKPSYYEIRQSMNDAPLREHPETGEKIRRVILGGYGIPSKSRGGELAGGCGGAGCCG